MVYLKSFACKQAPTGLLGASAIIGGRALAREKGKINGKPIARKRPPTMASLSAATRINKPAAGASGQVACF
jgi:hypothetical protein